MILAGVVVALALGFRRDTHDIKTGTVGKPAPVFELDLLDGSGRLSLAAYFFYQVEDGIRDGRVTGVQTCALPICSPKVNCGGTQMLGRSLRKSSAGSR